MALEDSMFQVTSLSESLSTVYLARCRGKETLHITERCPEHYHSLLTIEQFGRLLLQIPPKDLASNLRLLRGDGKAYELDLAHIDASIRQALAQGFTISLSNAARYWLPLRALTQSLSASLQTRANTNIYYALAGSTGFPPHADDHEVFALQIHGNKRWTIYHPDIEKSQRALQGEILIDLPPIAQEIDLQPGDLLYLPFGLIHKAETRGEQHSLHVTIGLYSDVKDARRTELKRLELDRPCEAGVFTDFDTEPTPLDRFLRIPLRCIFVETPEHVEMVFAGNRIRGPKSVAEAFRFIANQTEVFAIEQIPGLEQNSRIILTRRLLRERLLRKCTQ